MLTKISIFFEKTIDKPTTQCYNSEDGKNFLGFFSLLRINFDVRGLMSRRRCNQMENKLVSYETMYIVDSTGTEEATAALVNKFKALIEENGTIESFNEWGKRKLAYPINDMTEGYYVLVNYTADPSFVAELERIFNITEGVMRSMTIRV
jgi:small subunit ribosomal protein S6